MANISTNQEAIDARDTLAFCEFSTQLSSECGEAEQRWDDAIGYAWSLSALGLAVCCGTLVVVERPDEEGNWPSDANRSIEIEGALENGPQNGSKASDVQSEEE